MALIAIHGLATVYRDDAAVTDPAILQSLDGRAYKDERFTDYLGGTSEEDVLAAALEPGGVIRFGYDGQGEALSAVTEYRSRRPLTAEELRLLVDYTMGQWSDGIGENWVCESAIRCGYTIMCLTKGDGVGLCYPRVEIVEV